jgi:menaquinone-dependent protoporphyrinogen oxidase
MARLLIVYGTMLGQTARVAGRMARSAREAGHTVDLVDAAVMPPHLTPADYDAVIVGGWVRGGQHPPAIRDFVIAHRDALTGRPAAFFSVSLFAASQRVADQQRAKTAMRAFLDQTSWRPAHAMTVAGALRYTQLGWLWRRVLCLVWMLVARWSGWSPPTLPRDVARDYEYTDWAAVERFVNALLADLARTPALAGR